MEKLISLRKISAEDYHKMIEADILHEDDRVELINGQIVEMSPIGSRHAACVNKINRLLMGLLGDFVIVSVQNPILLSPFSEPEPDLSILKSREDFYVDRLPEPDDILWLIEIADTSLGYDTEIKLPLYAQAGIKEVWIVDLNRNEVRVHQQPSEDSFTLRSIYRPGSTMDFQTLQITLEIDKMLP